MATEGALVGGRFRLDQPIGRGRAGIVWLGFDTRLHRTVAAKPMLVPPGTDPEQAVREGREATRVAHACVITVHDVLNDGGQPWLIMEYVPSRNMADFLTEHGQLTAEQAAFLGIQLASALTAAHTAGVLHRRLEPGNVLLADDGGVKVTDIGITGGGPDPAYLAPEVARGTAATQASDAFSLGATLYTAVEGVPPFGEQGSGQLRTPQRAGALTGALSKLLRLDPLMRPTMADTISSLEAITQGRQTAFIPPTAPAMPTVPAWPIPQHQPAPPRPTQQSSIPEKLKAPLATATSTAKGRAWILAILAIVVAASVGIGITQLLFL